MDPTLLLQNEKYLDYGHPIDDLKSLTSFWSWRLIAILIPLGFFTFIVFNLDILTITTATNSELSGLLEPLNFTKDATTDDFIEISDTVRSVGKSKADFTIVQSDSHRNAILFTLLDPQPNGACFAGVESSTTQRDWTKVKSISLLCKNTGAYNLYSFFLRNGNSRFEQEFQVQGEYSTITLLVSNFVCFRRGKRCEQELDVQNIDAFGFQATGGVYKTSKISGVAALEIKTIMFNF